MSYLSEDQIKVLLGPLNQTRVETRKQAGTTLSYLAAYDVRAHLTRIFGFGRWSAEVVEKTLLFETEQPDTDDSGQQKVDNKTGVLKTKWYVAWTATVKLTIYAGDGTELGHYSDVAVGGNTQPQRHEANDMSLKTAVSDALKRAAANLGDQFGLSLYNKDNQKAALVRQVLVRALVATEAGDAMPDLVPEPTTEHDAKLTASIGLVVPDATEVQS